MVLVSQQIALKLSGLSTDPNPLGSVPEGALIVAENVVVDKQDVLELRRGFNRYGNAFPLTGDEQLNSNYVFQSRMIVSYGTSIAYDSDGLGTWVNYTNEFSPPDNAYKMRSVQQNKNFYLTTSSGVYKLPAYNHYFVPAGAPQSIGGTLALTTGSFFETNNQVAYRIVFGYTDENGNLILGAPCAPIVISNSGAAQGVNVTGFIPDEAIAGYFYQVYRSAQSGGLAISPNDELGLLIQNSLAAADITNGYFIFYDNVPDAARGASLYTSPSQEGISQSNYPPPLCVDMCLFNNSVFYFNTTSKANFLLTMLSTGGTTSTALSTGVGYYAITCNTTNGSNILTSVVGLGTNIVVGQLIQGLGIPASLFVVSYDAGASTLTMTGSANSDQTGTTLTCSDLINVNGTGVTPYFIAGSANNPTSRTFEVSSTGNPAVDIQATAINFVNVFNQSTNADTLGLYAFYDSTPDEFAGQIIFQSRTNIDPDVTFSSTKPNGFFPALPVATPPAMAIDYYPNYVYFSKPQQPEAVPLVNYIPIGSADKAILRGIALKDSIVVLKEDGIYRITGEDVTNFRTTLFDNTVVLIGPESAVAFNNQIYCYSNQGVIAINDNGVAVISRPIESTLLRLSSANFPNFPAETFGIAYESGRKYILWTVTTAQENAASQAFVYNSFTNSWTTWTGERTFGLVNYVDDKLYLCSADPAAPYIYQERKNYDIFDYADDSFDVSILDFSGAVVTLADAGDLETGFTLFQGVSTKAIIIDIVGDVVTVDRIAPWEIADATAYKPIASEIKWAPTTGNNPGVIKQFSDIMVFFRQANFDDILMNFTSNFTNQQSTVPMVPVRSGQWGNSSWGTSPWGGGPPLIQPIRTYVPLEMQRCNWLNIGVFHNEALTVFAFCGLSVTYHDVSTRMR
jgi:hypothetical protein